jgi:hypothetical protein
MRQLGLIEFFLTKSLFTYKMFFFREETFHRNFKNFFLSLCNGIQDNLEWKRTMKSLPFSIFEAIGLNFLSHQSGIAIAICANFHTPNFKGSACAGL